MAEKRNGMYRDFIIHPGETLRDLIDERQMNQKELAIRTGFSEKHVSEVINEKAGITPRFADALECVFGVSAEFWMNRQTDYEVEVLRYEQADTVTQDELDVLSHFTGIVKYLKEKNIFAGRMKKNDQVLGLRKLLSINRLTAIPDLTFNCAYRGSKSVKVDPYVLYAWQKICEIESQGIYIEDTLDCDKLERYVPKIRSLMNQEASQMQAELTRIFSECGIKFCIVKHFSGAPVQGFIERTADDEVILCMTIRGAFADIFWFTLFHEIKHILSGDFANRHIDFTFSDNETERAADRFAAEVLIPQSEYAAFIERDDFSLRSIRRFAKSQDVPAYIVIGRLQKEGLVPQNYFSAEKVRYKWVS